MTRTEFRVTSTAGHAATKYKWNSANREIERMVRELARAENTTYTLTASESQKHNGLFATGLRRWISDMGKVVIFYISSKWE